MKILLDSHSTVTQNKSGGLQVRIFDHFRALEKKGISCKLFNKWEDKIENFDIYHLFKVTKDSYNEVLYAKQKGKKVIVSAVVPINGQVNIVVSLFLASIFRFSLPHRFIQKVFSICDIITTQTEDEKIFINKYYKINEEKIVVIPNGVNNRFLSDKIPGVSFKEEYKINDPFILQVGRIDKNKNQLNVIKALKGLNIPVVFIGGAYLNELEYFNICKRELGSNMIMTDWIDHSSDLIISAFREAKVLVLPSMYETFGNVLVEAGVSGTSIACSKTIPINGYSISNFWTKFDPQDITSIREAVIKEYYGRTDDRMKEDFISTFAWDNVIEKYISIYNQLLNKNGRIS